ncbi:STAS domain-containing protein [Streptomyces lunaelactis]|uniref:STAS domain-containing protein n=1 Tax=Streptomyces lunaelactis TaxID=1535768 RepID=UPI00158559E3|nr:STAS domain-containing protein [Streptomyces lunaelactis]NUK23699.1 STAS domain-containing protein [Streptomyces lunaelactis]
MQIVDHGRVSVGCHVANGWTVVEATGEMDIFTSPMIRAAIIKLLQDGHRHFVLDLCPTAFLDSMGLGMIVAITKRIQAHQGSLRIACADQRLLHIFSLGGLRKSYAFHDSVDEATREVPRHNGLGRWPRPRD